MSTQIDEPAAPAPYENFIYLVAELEAALDRRTIHWSAPSVRAAQQRLAKLSAELHQIAASMLRASGA
jgi:hypothetical protein